jgi:hypothetical protein
VQLDSKALAEARAQALALDQRGCQNSAVYGSAPPAE